MKDEKDRMVTYLLKLGELTLKGGNREEFEKKLRFNLQAMIRGNHAQVDVSKGRFFVRCPEESKAAVENALDRLIGIAGWAEAVPCDKTVGAVLGACVEVGKKLAASGAKSFKIESRRADKGFPLDSYGIMREAGSAVSIALPSMRVDVREPEAVIEVEIREKAYIYGMEKRGRRGLPVGTGGRALLLLSGGIDSPVAGYMMARRGMKIDAVYFHAHPYTSQEARDKVRSLASILGGYALGVKLWTVPFTDVQLRIRERAPGDWTTILMRMAMMEIADRIARANRIDCLVTGESVGQVASQTIQNMTCVQSRSRLPVLRPLVGTDKIDTVDLAKAIGTYGTSILPYEDCCSLFSPKHPILKADPAEADALYASLELGELLETAYRSKERERLGAPPEKKKAQG